VALAARRGQLSPSRFDPYEELSFHDCEAGLWAAIDLDTGRVRGELNPVHIRAEARAIFEEATGRLLERLAL
jgi:hypothetical protein